MKLSKNHLKENKPFHFILLWFFISLFFIKNFLSPTLFSCQLVWVRHEIKEKLLYTIPDDELIQINKPLSFNDTEFELNGVMYDVVKTITKKDKKVLYCYLDGKETSLNTGFQNSISTNFDKNPLKKEIVSKIKSFFQIVIICQCIAKIHVLFSFETKKIIPFFASKLLSLQVHKITPPPNLY